MWFGGGTGGLLALLVLVGGVSGWSTGRLRGLRSRPKRGLLAHAGPGAPAGMERVLFIECGFGNDQHGQNPTKACVRACRNAIEFNSIPSIAQLVPGGYDNMRLRIQLGVPEEYHAQVDLDAVAAVFPYGRLLPIELVHGGMRASSGIALEAMGDKDDSMILAIAVVTVGY